ncbi:MAG TPA: OsmC family protein [Mycobacteriales bacterium]|nr:OsmC family protein [Mycobacteriales bacterium]
MGSLSVAHEGGDHFTVAVRGHVLHVDQPVEDHGEDLGPTPVDLLVAGLASCIAHYARRYLRRHDLATAGLRVDATWETVQSPSRVGWVAVSITLPDGFPAERREALLAVASHCTVHNSLTQAPDVTVALA